MTRASTGRDDLHNFDGYSSMSFEENVELMKQARTECPVVHSDNQGGFFLVSRYADVRDVLGNPAVFSSRNGLALPRNPDRPPTPPIDQDGRRHRDFRKILNPFMTPAAIAEYAETIRSIAHDLMASFESTGMCDLVSDYTDPFPAMVLARTIFGLDDRYEDQLVTLKKLVSDMGHENSDEDSVGRAWRAANEFARQIVRDRRTADPRQDLIAAMINGTVEGEPIPEDVQVGTLAITMLGGLKTTSGLLGTIIADAVDDVGAESRLRDPDWVRAAIDEYLRLNPPIQWGGREATQDVTLAGTEIHAGDAVMFHIASANRDEAEFSHPDEFDPQRPEANRHLGFGFGVHRCVGAHLARLEITIAVTELMNTITELRWQEGRTATYTTGQEWGHASLPITFKHR